MLGQNVTRLEALLWSIALPGFGQLLNKKHIKGILFIVLEFLINMGANFNEGIRLSFLGETRQSLEVMNMQWLMFYPCLYFFIFLYFCDLCIYHGILILDIITLISNIFE